MSNRDTVIKSNTSWSLALWITACLANPLPGKAQDVHNFTSLYIPATQQVHINGTLNNNSFVQNNGVVSVSGDWINQSVYQGVGTVVLNGIDQKVFNNKQPFATTIIQSRNINIEDKIIVSEKLELISGIVHVDDKDTLMINENAIVTGGSVHSFVNGALTQRGTGYKYFPVGKMGSFLPMEFLDVKGIDPVFEIEVFENRFDINLPEVTGIHDFIWQRTSIAGHFQQSAISLVTETAGPNLTILQNDVVDKNFVLVNSRAETTEMQGAKIQSVEELTGRVFTVGNYNPGSLRQKFYLSTALSPQASLPDNRYIKIFGSELKEENFQFKVFDRWGKEVFSTSSLKALSDIGWDGKNDEGSYLASGSYPYILRATSYLGKSVELRGAISLLNE